MYTRIDFIPSATDADDGCGGPDASTPGLLGSMRLRQLAGPAGASLTFWDSQANAASCPEVPGRPATSYDVADSRAGRAADERPSHAALLHFDGPQAPEQVAAADFGWRERIWPAIADLPGLVGVYALVRHDLGALIIHLSTSMAALETVGQTVMSTKLLPGEDPALLRGPDRIEFHRVTSYVMPVGSEPPTSR